VWSTGSVAIRPLAPIPANGGLCLQSQVARADALLAIPPNRTFQSLRQERGPQRTHATLALISIILTRRFIVVFMTSSDIGLLQDSITGTLGAWQKYPYRRRHSIMRANKSQ
jgi:hypothetical protein